MKRHIFYILIFSLYFQGFSSPAAAFIELSPEETVTRILAEVKRTGSPAALIPYVDWETVFYSIPQKQRLNNRLQNAADVQKYYQQILQNPANYLEKQFEKKMAQVPEDAKSQLEVKLQDLLAKLDAEMSKVKKQMLTLEYQVGQAVVSGDKAEVPVQATISGQKKQERVKLVKRRGRWLLPSLGVLGTDKTGLNAKVGALGK